MSVLNQSNLFYSEHGQFPPDFEFDHFFFNTFGQADVAGIRCDQERDTYSAAYWYASDVLVPVLFPLRTPSDHSHSYLQITRDQVKGLVDQDRFEIGSIIVK